MPGWTKRSSRKTGTHSRATTTKNSSGAVTFSRSAKFGADPRVTTSVIHKANGKISTKTYLTEHNKALGTRTTRLYPEGRNKPPKSRSLNARRRKKLALSGVPAAIFVVVAIVIILNLLR